MLRRTLTRAASFVLALVLLAPLLALLAGALLDFGPEPNSPVRFSLFPLVLAVFDPLTWTSFWNSLLVAMVAACGSVVVGVGFGSSLVRWRFWGRPFLFAMLRAPAVIPPAFSALGMLFFFDRTGPRRWNSLAWPLFLAPGLSERAWPWLVWTLAALIQGTALVLIATALPFRCVNADREDAARLAGAGARRIWWTLTWPSVRPAALVTGSFIFMITFADPGAPLVLGLRRTIAYQLVATAMQPDPFPRIAALGLMITALTLSWQVLTLWRLQNGSGYDVRAEDERAHPARTGPSASRPWTVAVVLHLAAWALLAWLPVAGLTSMALERKHYDESPHPMASLGVVDLVRRLTEDPAPRLFSHSALLGLGVVAVFVVSASLLPRVSTTTSAMPLPKIAGFLSSAVPPLVVGVTVLALSRAAGLGARLVDAGLGRPRTGAALEAVARSLDPYGVPGLALFLGVCAASLPSRLLACRGSSTWVEQTAHGIDLAVLSGAGRGRARWLAVRSLGGMPARRIVLLSVVAASAITPAILLAPTLECQPIGPGIVILAADQGESGHQAAALALAIVSLNLAVLGWVWAGSNRGRSAGHLRQLEACELV
jgi:ABC-type Fe3+ transport system permease subunit